MKTTYGTNKAHKAFYDIIKRKDCDLEEGKEQDTTPGDVASSSSEEKEYASEKLRLLVKNRRTGVSKESSISNEDEHERKRLRSDEWLEAGHATVEINNATNDGSDMFTPSSGVFEAKKQSVKVTNKHPSYDFNEVCALVRCCLIDPPHSQKVTQMIEEMNAITRFTGSGVEDAVTCTSPRGFFGMDHARIKVGIWPKVLEYLNSPGNTAFKFEMKTGTFMEKQPQKESSQFIKDFRALFSTKLCYILLEGERLLQITHQRGHEGVQT